MRYGRIKGDSGVTSDPREVNKMIGNLLLLLLGLLVASVCAKDRKPAGHAAKARAEGLWESPSTVWEGLKDNGLLSDFRNMIARLPDVRRALMNKNRKFLVFAPTNRALRKFLHPMRESVLEATIRYHIVETNVTTKDLASGAVSELRTMLISAEGPLTGLPTNSPQIIAVEDGKLGCDLPDRIALLKEPIHCGNGAIYHLDMVMTPPSNLPRALRKGAYPLMFAHLKGALARHEGLTLFVPSQQAFEKASHNGLDDKLTLRHAVAGAPRYYGDLKHGLTLTAMDGSTLRITTGGDGKLYVNGQRIVQSNILTGFGVVHVLEGLIEPTSAATDKKEGSPRAAAVVAVKRANAEADKKAEEEVVVVKAAASSAASSVLKPLSRGVLGACLAILSLFIIA